MLPSSALLLLLNLVIFALELRGRLARKNLLNNGSLLLLASKTVVCAIGRARNDRAHLAKFGDIIFLVVLLEKLLAHRNDVAHTQDLEVSFQLRREVGPGHIEPRVGVRNDRLRGHGGSFTNRLQDHPSFPVKHS